MSPIKIAAFVGLFIVALPGIGTAADPLVTPAWILEHIDAPGVVFLDVRHPSQFSRGTVPGAVNTSYGKGWRVKRKGIPGLLPSKAQLEAIIGSLGIINTDHVVILAGGYSASEMGVATRIYWTFKVSGHDQVSILNGGMGAYFALGKKAKIGSGNAKPERGTYIATMRENILATEDDVRSALKSGAAAQTLIDHRPPGQYLGINNGGAPKRNGTLPSALNAPAQWLTVDDGGTFRSAGDLKKLYSAIGIKPSGSIINFCNTGHWASVGWFVMHELMGNKDARLYDGSMAEWTNNPKNPVEQKVPIN